LRKRLEQRLEKQRDEELKWIVSAVKTASQAQGDHIGLRSEIKRAIMKEQFLLSGLKAVYASIL
jgi:hypothetical protein